MKELPLSLDLLLHGLAVFRLSLMVSKESGPFWMFKIFRRQVKAKAPKAAHLDEGIHCLWCVSMQLAIIAAIARQVWSGNLVYDLVILALALSAVAVILNQQFTKS